MGVQERREREREARRRSVLDATRDLVRERGFGGTTTRLIAERAELSEATVFFYFSNKDEIFVSLLFEAAEYMGSGLNAILSDDPPADQRLQRLWEFFGDVSETHPEYFDVSTYLAFPGSTDSVPEETLLALTAATGENFTRLADILTPLVSEERARVAGDTVWSTFLGLFVLRRARRNLGSADHPRPEDFQVAMDLVASGIGSIEEWPETPQPPPRRDWQTVAPPYD